MSLQALPGLLNMRGFRDIELQQVRDFGKHCGRRGGIVAQCLAQSLPKHGQFGLGLCEQQAQHRAQRLANSIRLSVLLYGIELAGGEQATGRRNPCPHLVHQRALANTGRTTDQHHAAGTMRHFVEAAAQDCQFDLTSDEARGWAQSRREVTLTQRQLYIAGVGPQLVGPGEIEHQAFGALVTGVGLTTNGTRSG